jgi:hypothetical protein
MAPKTTKGKPPMPATKEKLRAARSGLSEEEHAALKEKLRAVRLELSEEEHAALRIEAAKQDVSLMHLARVAVRDYLARHTPKGTK